MADSDATSKYIKKDDDGTIAIMEDAYITPTTINKFRFEFNKPNDITNSLKKNNKLNLQDVNDTIPHKTAYSGGKVVYPDGNSTAMVMFRDVVIQYREGLERSETTDYAKTYVCIGYPVGYIAKMTKDGKSNSSLTVAVRDKFKTQEGCTWIDCSLENVPIDQFYAIDTDGEVIPVVLQTALKKAKRSFRATILTSLSATMRNDSLTTPLDMTGTFYLTMKPTEVYLHSISPLQGPKLDNTNARKREKGNVTEKLVADSELIALLKNL